MNKITTGLIEVINEYGLFVNLKHIINRLEQGWDSKLVLQNSIGSLNSNIIKEEIDKLDFGNSTISEILEYISVLLVSIDTPVMYDKTKLSKEEIIEYIKKKGIPDGN